MGVLAMWVLAAVLYLAAAYNSYVGWRRQKDVIMLVCLMLSSVLLTHAVLHILTKDMVGVLVHAEVVRVSRVLIITASVIVLILVREYRCMIEVRETLMDKMTRPLESYFKNRKDKGDEQAREGASS